MVMPCSHIYFMYAKLNSEKKEKKAVNAKQNVKLTLSDRLAHPLRYKSSLVMNGYLSLNLDMSFQHNVTRIILLLKTTHLLYSNLKLRFHTACFDLNKPIKIDCVPIL